MLWRKSQNEAKPRPVSKPIKKSVIFLVETAPSVLKIIDPILTVSPPFSNYRNLKTALMLQGDPFFKDFFLGALDFNS